MYEGGGGAKNSLGCQGGARLEKFRNHWSRISEDEDPVSDKEKVSYSFIAQKLDLDMECFRLEQQ